MNSRLTKIMAGLCVVVSAAISHAEIAPLPLCCSADFDKLELVPLPGVDASVSRLSPEQGGPLLTISFAKAGEERRFVALETLPRKPLSTFKALSCHVAGVIPEGAVIRPALMAYEEGDGVWFKAGKALLSSTDITEMRMSLGSFREVAFSRDASNEMEWAAIRKLWFGFIIDGKGEGTIKLGPVFLTSEPFKPSKPVPVLLSDNAKWGIAADPAVKHASSTVADSGVPCVHFDFTFPGGRHMYFTPGQPVPEMEYSSYSGLRIVYRARTPKGIDGLLVQIQEDGGGSFIAFPVPPATGKWETIDLPFAKFKLAGWTKDANGKLDVDVMSRISIGAHGAASGSSDGAITIKSINVIP